MKAATVFRILFYGAIALIVVFQALIAVPGLIESLTRSRISKLKNEMRAASVALEAYRVDHGAYPPPTSSGDGWTRLPILLTTPTAYLPGLPIDEYDASRGTFGYAIIGDSPDWWVTPNWNSSTGPDVVVLGLGPTRERRSFRWDVASVYDPSNGTSSPGYLYHFSNPEKVAQSTGRWWERREAETAGSEDAE